VIKIMLADDHPVVRAGVRDRLNLEPDMEVVLEIGEGADVLQLAATRQIDVLVLDLNMPGLRPSQVVRQIKLERPGLQVLILSAYYNEELVRELFRAGVTGYVSKDETLDTIVRGVRNVAQGLSWLSPQVTKAALGDGPPDPQHLPEELTMREVEVLQLLAQGMTNDSIGEHLSISTRTVKFHVGNIYAKLNISSRLEATLYAIQSGLISVK
jgi:DNA-binding NarL/FixJ family response regulator